MKKLFKNIFLFVLLLQCFPFGFWGAYAQLYPVQITPVFNSPYSVKISDYATSMDAKMQLLINPTDISINNRQVRLKFSIQGNGINAQSADFIQGQNPIFINGGELQTLTNVDIVALFRLENLQGITAVQYANPLPEGMYNFCFEVYDFVTNQKISQKSCSMLYLILNDPPLLNTPQRNEQIAASEFPNILFTWTPRQINATNVSYTYELKELLDPNLDPQYGFLMAPLLYQETDLHSTALVYDLGKPNLVPGKRYAWRVRAVSTSGLSENSVFKNDGYSEVFSFKYTGYCLAPTFLLSEAQGPRSVKISWQGVPEHTRYQLQYKKQDVANAQWFSVYSLNTQSLLSDLEAGVTYQFRVGSSCDPVTGGRQSFTYSGINTFTTPTQTNGIAAYNCGITPKVSIQNQKPIDNLIVSETFTAGDFPVKILELSDSHNPYSGKGYIIVPYLADTKIAVEFSNITINTDYQLINGIVETSYNANWKNVGDLEDFTGEGVGGQIEETVPFVISNITIDSNKDIIVNGPNGEQITVPGGKDTVIISKGENGQPGKVYTVDSNGNVSGATSIATGGKSTPENTDGVDKNGQAITYTARGITIQFTGNGSKYAFDVMPENAPKDVQKLYVKVGSTPLPYKAVVNGDSDTLLATLTIADNTIKPEEVIFKTQNGALIESRRNGSSFILTVKGNQTYAEEQVLATIKQGDKWKVIGAFMLVHISPKEVNVVLVKLNNATIPLNATTDLERIYKTVGVKYNISPTVLNLDYNHPNKTSVTVGDSDFFATYTGDEQLINNQIKSSPSYKTNSYYLIYSDLPPSKADVKGFMALKGQYGFVFPKAPFNTGAHELGHGALGLEHPFKTEIEQGKTNFLMDYGDANASILWHNDWKQINDPKFRLYMFQEDSEGEQIATTYNYILPNFQPFKFNDADGKKVGDVLNVNSENNGGFPNGTLYGFTINNIDYVYQTDTQKFKPEYPNNYKPVTDSKKSFRLIIQSETNSCNYYLVGKKIGNINAKLDLNTLNTQPIAVCKNDGKIPFNDKGNAVPVSDFASTFKNLKAQLGDNSVASEVLVLDQKDPNYKQKLSDAKKKTSYILATYDSTDATVLKLEYKLEVPKALKELFPNMQFDDKCTAEYINKSLDNLHNSSIYKNCGLSGTKASLEVLTIFYQGYFGFYKCAFGEEKMANQPVAMQFIAGASYCAITTIDVLDLAKGLLEIIKNGSTAYAHSYVDYYKNLAQIKSNLYSGQEVKTKQILGVALLPPYNVAPVAIEKGLKIGETFKDKYFVNCDNLCWYRYGEMSVMIIPIIYTGGEYAVTKIKQISDISKISVSLTENVLKLNEKLIAKSVVLEEKAGVTLIKDLEGKVLKEVEGADYKKIEEALEDVGKIPTPLIEGKNVFRGSSFEYSLANKRINEYLKYETSKINDLGLPDIEKNKLLKDLQSKNKAYLEGHINNIQVDNTIIRSGKEYRGEQIFEVYKVDKNGGINTEEAWLRNQDTEYVLLSEVAQKLGGKKGIVLPEIKGELKIVSELPYCVSCQGVLQDFSTMFPGIDVILIDNLKY
jgi:hypothetical protein